MCSSSSNNPPETSADAHRVWTQTQLDSKLSQPSHDHEELDDYGFMKMTVSEYRPWEQITSCDECHKDMMGDDECYVDGGEGSLSWVVCPDCYHTNYAFDGSFEDDAATDDGRVMPMDMRSESMKKPEFIPSNYCCIGVKAYATQLGIAAKTECTRCHTAFKSLHDDEHLWASADGALCTGCFKVKTMEFSAAGGYTGKMQQESNGSSEHKLSGPTPVPWTKAVIEVHDKKPNRGATCEFPDCKKDMDSKIEAWFFGDKDTCPVICDDCYKKHQPKAGEVPQAVRAAHYNDDESKQQQQPPQQPTQQSWSGFGSGYTTTNWHHTHKPEQMIEGKDKKWGVWVGSRDGVVPSANEFDIAMNLSGRTILQDHSIPIPELEKWANGGNKFTEIIMDWPDGDAINLPLQFWLDLMTYLQEKQRKLVVFCIGGHGRTGTALACMLIAGLGWKAKKAIAWVRSTHCQRAIETKRQEDYIFQIGAAMKKYKKAHPDPDLEVADEGDDE
jgi:hypothetical protein